MTMTKDKKQILLNMANLAKERRKHKYWNDENGLICYIRLNSDGFRLVSLESDNPCGKIMGDHGKVLEKMSFEKAFEFLNKKGLRIDKPGNNKGEHRVQSFLINQAFSENGKRDMPGLLGCDNYFDELIFVDDELSIESSNINEDSIRVDMIFLGKKGEQYFPVFVELKASRLATKLCDQLNNACALTSDCADEFVGYLSAATEVGVDNIDYNKLRRIAIWPKGGDGELSPNALSDASDIIIVGYKGDNYDNYIFEVEKYT